MELILKQEKILILFCYMAKQFYFYNTVIFIFSSSVKEQIRQLITAHNLKQGQLKILLHNLEVIGALTENSQNQILDEIQQLEDSIQKLKSILNQI